MASPAPPPPASSRSPAPPITSYTRETVVRRDVRGERVSREAIPEGPLGNRYVEV